VRVAKVLEISARKGGTVHSLKLVAGQIAIAGHVLEPWTAGAEAEKPSRVTGTKSS